jgi:hypothetical protein
MESLTYRKSKYVVIGLSAAIAVVTGVWKELAISHMPVQSPTSPA